MGTMQYRSGLILLALIIFTVVIQFSSLRSNPPGFFIDESSIAYNAYNISTTGKDEHGESWPLYFRAFGEFKNPVYIYLLAGVFRVAGPGILSARSLSAFAGLLTAILLGLLAYKITSNRAASLAFAVLCLLTPWLFELSRLVMEVALYPLAIALFLLAVWNAANRTTWGIRQISALASTLALLTYTYSIGRLLAPLLAVGLIIFVTRRRLAGFILTWVVYFVTLIPILVFNQNHPSALLGRFKFVSYISSDVSAITIVKEFVSHYGSNLNPWRLFISESSRVSEILHIPGPPAMLTVTLLLLVFSVVLLIRLREVNAWWCFVTYGLMVSVVPAALTIDSFHMLRLAPVPVFLLTLTIPAIKWLSEEKTRLAFLMAAILLMTVQGMFFQWRYHQSVTSPRRLHTFDADYPGKILPTALARADEQPIYLADNSARPAYIQAYWYALLQHIPLRKFTNLGFDKSPPEGAVVITTEERCSGCQVLAKSAPYTTYIAPLPPQNLKPLTDEGMKAELNVATPPAQLRSGQQVMVSVAVRNASPSIWPAGDRSNSPFRVSVGNHWLDQNGNIVVNDDGRAFLQSDLGPGDSTNISLMINAPRRAGRYLLEVDLLQEGVSWFGLKGSKTWRGEVIVN